MERLECSSSEKVHALWWGASSTFLSGRGLLKGNLEVSDALDIMRKMSEVPPVLLQSLASSCVSAKAVEQVYAVPLNDLWLDADDTSSRIA